MNRAVPVVVPCLFLFGASVLFAQDIAVELAEPVVAPVLPATELSLPAPYSNQASLNAGLWDFDRGDSSETLCFEPIAAFAQAAASDAATSTDTTTSASESDATEGSVEEQEIPKGLLNNQYYRESQRLKALALEAFEYGDYDASANYAAEAAKAALRSDEYVALRLKMKATDDALAAAKSRLDWATSIGADKTYADKYAAASSAYEEATGARTAEQWDDSIAASKRVVEILADVSELAPLPLRYTVRPWAQTRDCFWNIAGYSWVYGDPTKWKVLYEANKTKLRNPNNPDLIHPGLILDIPSLYGEVRQGMWISGRAYAPLPKRK